MNADMECPCFRGRCAMNEALRDARRIVSISLAFSAASYCFKLASIDIRNTSKSRGGKQCRQAVAYDLTNKNRAGPKASASPLRPHVFTAFGHVGQFQREVVR